jgi:hypothetical protein
MEAAMVWFLLKPSKSAMNVNAISDWNNGGFKQRT